MSGINYRNRHGQTKRYDITCARAHTHIKQASLYQVFIIMMQILHADREEIVSTLESSVKKPDKECKQR